MVGIAWVDRGGEVHDQFLCMLASSQIKNTDDRSQDAERDFHFWRCASVSISGR
jgi:hypothetical protein